MTSPSEQDVARRNVRTYVVLTISLSSIFYALIASAGSLNARGGLYVLALMWCPGVAALVTRFVYEGNVKGVGWQWGEPRWQLFAYVIPVMYGAVAYGAVWLTGLGTIGRFQTNLLLFVILGTAYSCVSALGEEIGWRGLLVPELAKLTDFTWTAFISGAIWALWHTPLILFADYNSGTPKAYALLCFLVMVTGISFAAAWLRLRSGSVWTGMLFHASHNLWIQGFFDRVTIDTAWTRWFTTEFGAALAVVGAVMAYVFWRLRTALVAP